MAKKLAPGQFCKPVERKKDDLDKYIRWLRKEQLRQGKGRQIDLLFEDQDSAGRYPISQRKAQRLVNRVCKGLNLARRNPMI